jgi:hypothetical protein
MAIFGPFWGQSLISCPWHPFNDRFDTNMVSYPNVHLAKDLLGEFLTIQVVVTSTADVIMTSEMAQMTSNWPILTHFGQFLTLYRNSLVFSYVKWPGKPKYDHPNGQKFDLHPQIYHFELKNCQNNPKWPQNGLFWLILLDFWPGKVLVLGFLM